MSLLLALQTGAVLVEDDDVGIGNDAAAALIALDLVEAGSSLDLAVDIWLAGTDAGSGDDPESGSTVDDLTAVEVSDDDEGFADDFVFSLVESTPNSQTILRGIENYTLGSGRSRRRKKPSDTDMQRAGKRWLSGGGSSEGDTGG